MQMYIREYMMILMVKYVADNEEGLRDNVTAAQLRVGGGTTGKCIHLHFISFFCVFFSGFTISHLTLF